MDGGAHVTAAHLLAESLQVLAQCIGRTGTKNLLCVVDHGHVEQRCKRRGGKRLLLPHEWGTEIRKERGQLVLDILHIQFGRKKEVLCNNGPRLRETESKVVFKDWDGGLGRWASIIR